MHILVFADAEEVPEIVGLQLQTKFAVLHEELKQRGICHCLVAATLLVELTLFAQAKR